MKLSERELEEVIYFYIYISNSDMAWQYHAFSSKILSIRFAVFLPQRLHHGWLWLYKEVFLTSYLFTVQPKSTQPDKQAHAFLLPPFSLSFSLSAYISIPRYSSPLSPSVSMTGVPPEQFISGALYVYVTLSVLAQPYPLLKRNEHVKDQG